MNSEDMAETRTERILETNETDVVDSSGDGILVEEMEECNESSDTMLKGK